jgi:hypothetical protein
MASLLGLLIDAVSWRHKYLPVDATLHGSTLRYPDSNGASRKLSQYDQIASTDYRPTPAVERMAENIGATEVEPTSDDLREIDRAFSTVTVQGARLSEDHMKLIDR